MTLSSKIGKKITHKSNIVNKRHNIFIFVIIDRTLPINYNVIVVKSNIFRQIFIPPCCNDSGLSLGAAAFYEWAINKKIITHSPYLNNWRIEDYDLKYSPSTIKETAQLLLSNKVIGICNEYDRKKRSRKCP